MSKITSVKFRLATDDDKHLPSYDNTKLQAYNTCPTWGVIRYQMHLRMPGSGRAMALEAGSAMHELFAWVRLCTLLEQMKNAKPRNFNGAMTFKYHGERIFGADRFMEIMDQALVSEHDVDIIAKSGAIAVLETSSFYDDPQDKRRTIANMTECAFAYIDKWRWKDRIWMRDENNSTGDVGIEIPFDLVVETTKLEDKYGISDHVTTSRRYTGKIDGIHVNDRGVIELHENKTASRLNDAWSMAFAVNTQPTGYMLAASVFTEQSIRDAKIHGISIPLPKSYDFGGIITEHVTRQDFHFKRWIEWYVETAEGYERDADNPINAQRYTHSCNRYFRPCSMIPFCDSDDDEERRMLKEMVVDEWSPLHEVEKED